MENYTYPPPPSANVTLHYRLITKYLLLLPGQHPISRDAALLAGLAALHDLDEIITRHADARLDDWREKHHDQTATISDLENALDDAVRRLEIHRDSAELWRTQYDISQTQLNAAEIECARLKTLMNESSSPTTAQTEPSEPAASSTSNTPAPTPSSPAASSGASADPAAPASSAPTSKRQRRSTPPPPTEEAGQMTTPNPIDWPAALARLLTPEISHRLKTETGHKWSRLDKQMQKNLIYLIAETLYAQFGTISQSIYDRYRPGWATDVSSWTKTTDLKWRDVLNHLQIVPSNLPLELRLMRSATQP